MNSTDPSLALLGRRLADSLDKQDIREVLVKWNRALDRGDVAMLASVYCEDAYDDHGKQQYASAAEAASDYIERHLEGARRTLHTTVQESIELRGSAAFCESYAIAYLVIDRLPSLELKNQTRDQFDELLVTVGIRYIDQFRRVDGSWRIAKRKMVMEWRTFSDSVPLTFDVQDQRIGFSLQKAYLGSRSHEDPAYDMASHLGTIGS